LSTPTGTPVDISVLITCYNEADLVVPTIRSVGAALQATGLTHEIIIINDASQDDSARVIREYLEKNELPVRHIENTTNRGLANNFIDGAFCATGRYYRLCCGDDSETADDLLRTFRLAGQADMVLPYYGQVPGKSRFRHVVSDLYTKINNLLCGYPIRYYNGMPLFRRELVLRYPPITQGFGFQADIVTRLLFLGCTYMQVFIPGAEEKKTEDRSSALNLKNLFSVMHAMLEIVIRRIRRSIYKETKRARELTPAD
jgi:glycosyltransferase involved in cell wall biosynthesis